MINSKLVTLDEAGKMPEALLFSGKSRAEKLNRLHSTIKTIMNQHSWFAGLGILPIDDINEVRNFFEQLPTCFKPKDTVVAWDIDQTVLTPESKILRDINGQYNDLVEDVFKLHCPNLDLMTEAYKQDKNLIIQPEIVQLIQLTQNHGIHTMGLTSRKPTLVDVRPGQAYLTDIHLKTVGVDFSSAFHRKYNDLDITGNFPEQSQAHGQKLFHHGVMMTSRSSKGEALQYLFSKMHYKPKCLVFIDDKISRLKEVRDYCYKNDIQFYGFHYRRFYKMDHAPDDAVVRYQMEYMIAHKIWLNDAEIKPSEQEDVKCLVSSSRNRI